MASPATSAKKTCLNPKCQQEAKKLCAKCKAVRFCGRDCQELLWDSHKALCKSIAREPEATVLLLDGMGMLGPGQFYAKAVQAALARAGLKVATVDITKKPGLFEQAGSVLHELERFTSCIVLAVGAGGEEEQVEFAENLRFRERLIAWVERGGRLVVQGERGGWPEWFDKTWEYDDYRRTTHECRAKTRGDVHWCKWYPEAQGSITSSINVKAMMMTGVPMEEILFGLPKSSELVEFGWTAVALGKFGEGLVSSFGDVNATGDTCAIMAVIARGP